MLPLINFSIAFYGGIASCFFKILLWINDTHPGILDHITTYLLEKNLYIFLLVANDLWCALSSQTMKVCVYTSVKRVKDER